MFGPESIQNLLPIFRAGRISSFCVKLVAGRICLTLSDTYSWRWLKEMDCGNLQQVFYWYWSGKHKRALTVQQQSDMTREKGRKVLRELRRALVQGAVLAVALCILFPGYFFRGETIAPTKALRDVQPWLGAAGGVPAGIPMRLMSDVITFFIPQYSLVQRALAQNEWPLWNPYQFGGMPLMANCQSSVFLPPRVLLAWFPLETAVSLFILIKLWLCGMAAWLTARQIRLGVAASFLYSIMWLAAPYCLLWSYWSLTDVAIAFPVTFLGAELALQGNKRFAGSSFFGMGVAWMLLAGHPETAFAFCWVLGVYIFLRLLWNAATGGHVVRPFTGLAVASGCALGITAVQWLPFLEYLLHSSTFFERQTQERFYYGLTSLISIAFPRFQGSFAEKNYWGNINSHVEMMLYAGVVALAAAPLAFQGLGQRLRQRDRHAVIALGLLVGAAVSIAAALDIGAMVWLNRLPFFRSMLWCYHAVFMVFALPLLGALGLDRLFSGKISWRYAVFCLAWCAAWAAFAWVGYRYHLPVLRMARFDNAVLREMLAGLCWMSAGLALIGLGVWHSRMPLRSPWVRAVLLSAMGLLVLMDASRALRMELPTSPKSWFYPETALIKKLQRLEQPIRIGLSEGGVVAGVLTPAGIIDWVGYDGLYPGRMWRFQRVLGPEFWNAMEPAASIGFYLNDPRYPPIMPEKAYAGMERVDFLNGLELLRNPKVLPWARLVFEVEEMPDPESQYLRMKDPGFNPGQVALVERLPEGWGGRNGPESSGTGSARVLRYTMNTVLVEAECTAPAILVTADAWFPGWKAWIDGRPTDTFPAYALFRSVALAPGKHLVEFRYRPASFLVGVSVTLITALVLVAVGCWVCARRIKESL